MGPAPRVGLFMGFDGRLGGGVVSMGTAMRASLERQGAVVTGFMPSQTGERLFRAPYAAAAPWDRWWLLPTLPKLPNALAPLVPSGRNVRHWRDFDVVHSVVGGGAWAAPGVLGRRSIAWVATPIEPELRARYQATSTPSRLALEGLITAENALEGAALRAQDQVEALSEMTAGVMRTRHHVAMDRLEVLYPPVDTTRFFPGDAVQEEVCVLTARLDDARKDVPLLLRAWPLVVERRPRARLLLVGPYAPDGPVAQALAACPARDSVTCTGALSSEKVAETLRRAALFTLPSRQEGLGIVALEAMACGVPTVTFVNGGTDELVTVSGAGEVVHTRSELAFAEAVARLLGDGGARGALRDAGLRFVQSRVTPAAFDANVARAYARLGVLLPGQAAPGSPS